MKRARKLPLFFQVLGDTTFFMPHLVHVPIGWQKKLEILAVYFKLTLTLFLIAPFKRINRATVLSFRTDFFDYRTLHLLFRAIFIRNDYYFKVMTDTPLIFDCGANIGFATFYFKWLYPRSEIHAFEPEPSTYRVLQKNVSQNGLDNVSCNCAAISDADGEADFYFDKDRPGNIQMSLLRRTFRDVVRVRTVSLSSYIREVIGKREIDFLKLDLEGVESDAVQDLAGSGCLLQARELFIECHHRIGNAPSSLAKILGMLDDNGFEYNIDTYYYNRYGEDIYQCINIFAARKGAVQYYGEHC